MVGSGCRRKPLDGLEEGPLSFSGDTVYFDTLFTTLESPSERLIVTNNTGHDVKITKVYLEKGSSSDFDLIFDGLPQNEITDYVLENGDSAVVFIDFVSDLKDEFARDRILFQLGDEIQDVDIEAYVMDAWFHQDESIGTSTLWTSDKPHLIDGFLTVNSGVTLTIQPGTEVYFTSRRDSNFNLISSIRTQGTLKARGTVSSPIIFQQSRFGERYAEVPGQWRGLSFSLNSSENILEHCLIKNGLIGVEADYGTAAGFFPKVRILKTEIRNMGAFGILGYGYSTPGVRDMILAENSLIHNCQIATFYSLGGGQYEFRNCTFANYGIDFSRSNPQIVLNNYDPDELVAFELKAHFTNCIIWGSEEEEWAPDTALLPDIFDLEFRNCIVRTTLIMPGQDNQTHENVLFPEFMAPTETEPYDRDYHIRASSPAVGAGQNIGSYTDDFDDVIRTPPYDIGCYEYVQ